MSTSTKSGFTPRKLYFVLAIAEACTWTLLITGLILRATTGIDQTLFTTIGGLHGLVFISYGATSILVAFNQRWGFWLGLLALVFALRMTCYDEFFLQDLYARTTTQARKEQP